MKQDVGKTIIIFIITFLLFIVPSIYAPFDPTWYANLNKPAITPPNYLFGIVWTIMYALISLSVALTLTTKTEERKLGYIILVIFNYIFIQLYSYLQFGLKNLELAFIDVILVLFTSLLLYYSTKKINPKAALLLIPLIIWVIYASFLQVAILRLN